MVYSFRRHIGKREDPRDKDASRAPRFKTTWPRNDELWGREWTHDYVVSQFFFIIQLQVPTICNILSDSEALDNIYTLFKQNIKSCNAKRRRHAKPENGVKQQ